MRGIDCPTIVYSDGSFRGAPPFAEPPCAEFEQPLPHLGCGLTECDAGRPDAQAAKSPNVVRCLVGDAHHHIHTVKCDVEFLCDELRERGLNSLAEFDFTREDCDLAVHAQMEVRVHVSRRGARRKRNRRRMGLREQLLRERLRRDKRGNHQAGTDRSGRAKEAPT